MKKIILMIFIFFLSLISLTSCISSNPSSSQWYLLSYSINDSIYYANEHNPMDHFGGLRVEDSTIEFIDFKNFIFKPYNQEQIEGTYTVGAKKVTLRIGKEKIYATCFKDENKELSYFKVTYDNADYVFHNDSRYYLLDYSYEEYLQQVSSVYYSTIIYQYDHNFINSNNKIHYGEIFCRNGSYYFICKDENCTFSHKFIQEDNLYIYSIINDLIINKESVLKEGICACSFDLSTATYENGLTPHFFSVCYYNSTDNNEGGN